MKVSIIVLFVLLAIVLCVLMNIPVQAGYLSEPTPTMSVCEPLDTIDMDFVNRNCVMWVYEPLPEIYPAPQQILPDNKPEPVVISVMPTVTSTPFRVSRGKRVR